MSSNQEIIQKIKTIINNKDKILNSLINEDLKKSFRSLIDQLEGSIKEIDKDVNLSNDLVNLFNSMNIC